MPVIQTGLFTLYERFPEYKEAIKAQFELSKNFRNLCSDYRRCLTALQHWNRSAADEAALRQREYQSLLQELEEEVLQHLAGHLR